MTHGSICSGIEGFGIAARQIGWETLFTVEIDDFCNQIIKKRFPDAQQFKDIKEFDGNKWRGKIDVLTGGIPCQPASVAGKRKGEADDRWLWDEAIRIVREVQPSYVVFENPTGILSLGNGKPFKSILSALENEGYKTELFIIPACSKEAWHKRERIWIIGYRTLPNPQCYSERQDGSGDAIKEGEQTIIQEKDKRWESEAIQYNKLDDLSRFTSNSNGNERCTNKGESNPKPNGGYNTKGFCEDVSNSNSEYRKELQRGDKLGNEIKERSFGWGDKEIRRIWQSEPNVGRVAHGIPRRLDKS
jgi:DNA-cytosine methyltransferase